MPYSECEVAIDGPLRQGDVIRPLASTDDQWRGPAVIVTADCDLARNKHSGRLSCVPILTLPFYLELFFLPPRASKLQHALQTQIGALIRRNQPNIAGFDHPISDDRAAAWILEESSANVAAKMSMQQDDAIQLHRYADTYASLMESTNGSFAEVINAMAQAQTTLGRQKAVNQARSALLKDVASYIQNLPGDAMFLNSISTEETDGYICYLRVIRELADYEVATRSSMRSFQIKFERISRLGPPFIYALSQRLGNVFSSIGLPDEYEAGRRECGQSLERLFAESE